MRYLLLLALCLAVPAWGATTSTTFAAVGAGPTVSFPANSPPITGTYSITGTFVATLQWQYSTNGATWQTLNTYTTTQAATAFSQTGQYRWYCSDYTSGSPVGVIVQAPIIYQQQFNQNGTLVFQVDSSGVTSNAFMGSGGGGTGTFLDLIVTDTASNAITLGGGITGTPATGTNTAGGNLTVVAGTGTGSGAGGSFIVQTAPAGSTGTTPGTPATALTIDSTKLATFVGNVSAPVLVSTVTTGTAPLTVASTTNVANLNASSLGGATFSAPGAIGGVTPAAAAFTTVSATGQITSTLANGTAPLVVASSTNVANLNASSLGGATFAAPGAIGGGTPSTGAFTSVSSTGASPQMTLTGASGIGVQENVTAVGAAGATIALSAGSGNQCLLTYTFGGTQYMQFGGNTSTPLLFYDAKNSYQTYDYQQAAASVAIHTFRATTEATGIGNAGLCTTGGFTVAKRSLLGTIGSTFKGNVIAGVQDGTADTAGAVGEIIQGTNTSAYTNYTTTNTLQQVATVACTAGRWRLVATGTYYGNGATVAALNEAQFVISTVTASATGGVEGRSIGYVEEQITSSLHATTTITSDVNVSATTSYFLNSKAQFSVGNPQFVGSITAYRVR